MSPSRNSFSIPSSIKSVGFLLSIIVSTFLVVAIVNAALTFTGSSITSDGTFTVVFEGATADDFETTLAATDPTADQTITLQNNAGIIPLGTAANTLFFTTTAATNVTLPTSGTLATLAGTETLTNKTLTTPTIASIVNTGTLTLPTSTDTLVGRATTDTLTNKTLTSPTIGTNILDTNGNKLLVVTATASAVNELTVANAATNASPTITASGTDANVGIGITTKGTGNLSLTLGNANGLVNVLTGNLKVGNGTPDTTLGGEAAYIEGGLEVDGTARFDGAATFNGATTLAGAAAFNGRTRFGRQTFTMSTAGAATENLTPSAPYIEITGQDSGDDIAQLQTGSATEGDIIIVTNIAATAVNIDSTATTKTIGAADAVLTQFDTIMFIFDGTNWLQLGSVPTNS